MKTKKHTKMNNYILVNRTFAEITPESSEIGDFSKQGFIDKNLQVSFSKLVGMMKEHYESSCSPDDGNINTWYSTGFFTSDYGKGIEREECIHFSRDNTTNAAKYWKLARLAANK